jgi:hypothetical protein
VVQERFVILWRADRTAPPFGNYFSEIDKTPGPPTPAELYLAPAIPRHSSRHETSKICMVDIMSFSLPVRMVLWLRK